MTNSRHIKGVLFDLDGTLLDTADDLGHALNLVLKNHQLPEVPAASYRNQASNGAVALLKLGFGNQYDDLNQAELRQQLLDHYQDNINRHTQLFPGIKSLLELLDSRSIPWGIVTNKPEFLTEPLVKCFAEFDTSLINISGDTLPQAKPHPAPLLAAANYLNVEPCDILYVGDALRDIEAGRNANMKTCIANWGYIADDENIDGWRADFVAETASDVELLIK